MLLTNGHIFARELWIYFYSSMIIFARLINVYFAAEGISTSDPQKIMC